MKRISMFDDYYRDVCENFGWTMSEVYEDEIELVQCSPAGEDFSFSANTENFVECIKEYAANFDVDEHIEMWIEARKNGVSGIPSTRELVEDAENIDSMLQELAIALSTAEENRCTKQNSIASQTE